MAVPLVTIVIPTYRRPQYLPRAVESALACQDSDVEVIVVPNGPDESWKHSLSQWIGDARLRVSPIEVAHGNLARNHGMSLAHGKYLRFLDDDDYLLPAARQQAEILDKSGADICSGLIVNVDMEGNNLGLAYLPETRDFVCAAVEISGFTLPVGNLFRRKFLSGAKWDPSASRLQDNVWMIDLASTREWHWISCPEAVGVWYHHDQPRTSSSSPFNDRAVAVIEHLFELHHRLTLASRSNADRRRAIARAIWSYAHSGFPCHPWYWSRVLHRVKAIDPDGRPEDQFFHNRSVRLFDPVLIEWLLLPVRNVTRAGRMLSASLRARDYRRPL